MELTATVSNIRWRSDSGWAVVDFIDETNLRFVGVGIMPSAYEGERLSLSGKWTIHKTYGRQFSIDEYRAIPPSTVDAIYKYLASGLIRGIGESTATAIIAKFGEESLNVIARQPEKLQQLSGIGKIKSKLIHESYIEKIALQEVIMGLQEFGITVNQAIKIFKLYGNDCVKRVKDNPYKLIEDVESIGFKTADKIAINAGVDTASPYRLKAGIIHTLNVARSDGNTCYPRRTLVMRAANELLNVEVSLVEAMVEEMVLTSELIEKHMYGDDYVFLPYLHYQEMNCAVRLMSLKESADVLPLMDFDRELEALENKLGIKLDDKQREAVNTAINEGVMVITGGPGTGKTTILRFIIELMEGMGLTLELAAPTGRAAKRISDTTGRDAQTIHRLLEYGYGADEFSRNDEYPIEADVIIVDETSMVDVPLFYALLKAINDGTRLVMVGDFDQLPPVGAGCVLRDIVMAKVIPVIRLTEIYRQAGRSMIVINAHRINNGLLPVVDSNESDFVFLSRIGMEEALNTVVDMCVDFMRAGNDGELQTLAPMKQGILGVLNLNLKLQEALNPQSPDKAEYKYGDTVFRVGDRVMQTKNNYRMEWHKSFKGIVVDEGTGVFNGDIGTIINIDAQKLIITILFDDERQSDYSTTELEDIELAYCISIHKSQGSEFSTVILPLVSGPPMLMSRNILYTAVTRARNHVYIVGRAKCIEAMISNVNSQSRYSAMGSFLCQLTEINGEE